MSTLYEARVKLNKRNDVCKKFLLQPMRKLAIKQPGTRIQAGPGKTETAPALLVGSGCGLTLANLQPTGAIHFSCSCRPGAACKFVAASVHWISFVKSQVSCNCSLMNNQRLCNLAFLFLPYSFLLTIGWLKIVYANSESVVCAVARANSRKASRRLLLVALKEKQLQPLL